MEVSSPSASRSTADRTTWRVVLEYDGTRFNGWQHQPEGLCIQDQVDIALKRVFGGEDIRVVASGRTDAGVHALGQVVSFRAQTPRPPESVRDGLNALLPPDIACLEAAPAHPDFHAQRSALGKLYRYTVMVGRARSALRRDRAWHLRWSMDLVQLRDALSRVQGEHDFTSFRAAGCSALSPVRTIHRAELIEAEDELHIELYGDGFLRHMVRNIVGSLIDVGRGRHPASWFSELLNAKDRTMAGRTAPARGLALVRVDYPAELLRAP